MAVDENFWRDRAVRHALEAERYNNGVVAKIVGLLNSVDDDITDQIASRLARIEERGFDLGPETTKRLRDLLAETRRINTAVYKLVDSGLRTSLTDYAGYEAEWAENGLRTALGDDISLSLPNPTRLREIVQNSPIDGHLLDSWTSHMSAQRQGRVEQAIRLGITQAQTTDQIVQRIAGTKAQNYRDGILETSRQSAASLVLTANATVANNSRMEVYRRNSDRVPQVEWLSTLDTRTTSLCQSRDGQVYDVDKAPQAPAHIRCRSVLIPVPRTQVAGRKRASMDGQVSRDTKYGDWLKDQSVERQNEVLGKERAELFRSGKVSFKDLFRDNGTYKSLEELRRAEGIAPRSSAPAAPVVAPAPVAPTRMTSAIDPAINDNTIRVIPRKDAVKVLNDHLSDAAQHPSYDPRPEFRGIKPEMFGKAHLSTAVSDEAASALAALWPEVNRITDAFALPRLRAVRTISDRGNAIANMGDATLGLNPVHLSGFAARVGVGETGAESAALTKLKAEQAKLKAEMDDMNARMIALKSQYEKLGTDPDNRDARLELAVQQRELVSVWSKVSKKEFTLRSKIRTMEKQGGGEPVSTWKPGDAVKDRPYTLDKYFSGIDKMRSVVYHETGHHIHQMLGRRGRRAVVGDPPLEKQLRQMFFAKFHGAAPGNLGRGSERKAMVTTTYGTTDPHEWWAESFAAYMMGRPDLADPDLVELIERLLDEIADN